MLYPCDFTHAVCRRPGPDLAVGLRSVDTGDPDPARFARDHAAYVDALRGAGIKVVLLDLKLPTSIYLQFFLA